jgi:hypothetical protein
MQKVSEEIAIQDFERWFESKRLPETKRRDEFIGIEKEMIEGICDGSLIVNDDFTITLKLAFPLSEPNEVSELKFVHRMATGVLQSKTAYVKDPKDQAGKLTATIAALTGQVGGIIRALDPVDFGKAGCVASYFF